MTEPPVLHRLTGRLLPIDTLGRVLLLHGFDPARPDEPFWFTIGGAVDGDESTAQAAAREAREETGLCVSPEDLGGPAWQAATRFSFDGIRILQEQDFYVVRVAPFDVVPDHLEPIEQATIDAYRWWTLEELQATDERYHPDDLVPRLRAFLASGRLPGSP